MPAMGDIERMGDWNILVFDRAGGELCEDTNSGAAEPGLIVCGKLAWRRSRVPKFLT